MHELNDKCSPEIETGEGFNAVRFCVEGAREAVCTITNAIINKVQNVHVCVCASLLRSAYRTHTVH